MSEFKQVKALASYRQALAIAEQLRQSGKFTSHEQQSWVAHIQRRLKELR